MQNAEHDPPSVKLDRSVLPISKVSGIFVHVILINITCTKVSDTLIGRDVAYYMYLDVFYMCIALRSEIAKKMKRNKHFNHSKRNQEKEFSCNYT